jgi:sarcosine oxidase gamma subunit
MTAMRSTLRAYGAAEKAASEAERANAPDAAELRAKAEALCEVLVAAEAAQEAAHEVYVEEADVEVLYPVPGDDPQNRETWHWCKGWVETVCGPGEWLIVVEDPRVKVMEADTEMYPTCFRDVDELRRPEPEAEAQAE